MDLSSYATKADLKNVAIAYASEFTKKTDLVNFKSDVEKLNFDK